MTKKILLTGATGFVGRMLLERLIQLGHQVHVLSRRPEKIKTHHPLLTVFTGDVRNPHDLRLAMKDCDSAYYLIHGLEESESFEYEEALAAQVFTQCSNELGLSKIIYLGGLGDSNALSPHLRSRHLTGQILALGRAKVLEFRASIVLGPGSTSYEIMKALVSRLPFLVDPKNLRERCQPLYWEDLMGYLVLGLEDRTPTSCVVEIGGPDQVNYVDLLKKVAQHSSLERKVIPVPELDPRLVGEVFDLIVPEYSRVGRHLIESLIYPTVKNTDLARELYPEITPCSISESLEKIGTIHSELGVMISKDHTLRVLMTLRSRFPEVSFLNGSNLQRSLHDFFAKQMSGLK